MSALDLKEASKTLRHGPYLIGLASDLLQPSYGSESLRYALLLSCVGLVLGVMHCLLAARRSAQDRVN